MHCIEVDAISSIVVVKWSCAGSTRLIGWLSNETVAHVFCAKTQALFICPHSDPCFLLGRNFALHQSRKAFQVYTLQALQRHHILKRCVQLKHFKHAKKEN